MGYGLPAAIGAQVAFPDCQVVNIDGDGSFLMSANELVTATAARLPVKVIILNNGSHGMVRQWQELFYGARYYAVDLAGSPDFVKLAEAYGCVGIRVSTQNGVIPALRQALATEGPVVLEVAVDREECVFPMVAPGMANKDMLLGKTQVTGAPGAATSSPVARS
jgi:acetolactate synthase-1/2/3 large subunit